MAQELSAQKWVKNESSGRTSALLSPGEGAPLRRGPRGLRAKLSRLVATPEVKVWARPLGRVLGMMGVLGCVAFLGKQSEEESTYGARVEMPALQVDAALPSEPEALEPKPQVEQALAQTEPPPCSEKKEAEGSSGILPDGRIIMNEATANDFTQLPGVGDARAAKIVELRARLGKFKQVADLLRVRGIGWKTLQAMKEKLVVDRPVEKLDSQAEENDPPRSQNTGVVTPSSS